MIRFLDKEVVCVDRNVYDRDELLRYFLKERNYKKDRRTEIVLIYDGVEYYGLATYGSVLNRYGEDGILREKYVISESEDLFSGLHRIFEGESESTEYIPIFGLDMQLLYFAYWHVGGGEIQLIERYVFPLFEKEEEILFLKDLYPQIEKVCIYDFNELAFRFYKVLKARGIAVEVFGEKWSMLYPEIYESDRIQFGNVLAERVMNVYAEGRELRLQENGFGHPGYKLNKSWNFLLDMAKANALCEIEKIKRDLLEKGIRALTMIFPDGEDLGYYTADEYYRNKMRIEIDSGHLNDKNPLVVQQVNRCWCKEGEDKFREATTAKNRRQEQSFAIGNESVSYMRFGSGRHTLYLVGPCIAMGRMVDREDSLGACIYHELQKHAKTGYKVECIGADGYNVAIWQWVIKSLTLCEGDLVVLIGNNEVWENNMGDKVMGYPGDVDMTGILNRRKTDWFWDMPIHTNQRGNVEIAKALVEEYLLEHLWDDLSGEKSFSLIQTGMCCLPDDMERELEKYTERIKEKDCNGEMIGAIIMNCNPMTKGHQYLIEQALEQVDFLYVFLVEEDRSEIPFADRLAIVQSVAGKYENIKVVPSGRFILSYETMPIYFEKAQKQEELLDAAHDLRIFGEKIAPRLGIKIRFAGEEPNDRITYQYNESMKLLFPAYGIRFVEIPRLELENEVVSASTVRKLMHEGRMDKCRQLVPEETYLYLLKKLI